MSGWATPDGEACEDFTFEVYADLPVTSSDYTNHLVDEYTSIILAQTDTSASGVSTCTLEVVSAIGTTLTLGTDVDTDDAVTSYTFSFGDDLAFSTNSESGLYYHFSGECRSEIRFVAFAKYEDGK